MGLDKDLTNTRMYTAFLHIMITACIYWTRRDNVMVALTIREMNDSSTFQYYDDSLKAMVQSGLFFLVLNTFCIVFLHPGLSMIGIILLLADIIGTFFSILFILDGYASYSFHWQYWFCIIVPLFINSLMMIQFVVMSRFEVIGGIRGFLKLVLTYITDKITTILSINYFRLMGLSR